MKMTPNVRAYILAALVLPGLFYVLHFALIAGFSAVWPAYPWSTGSRFENWSNAIGNTAGVLVSWAIYGYIKKRRQDRHESGADHPAM